MLEVELESELGVGSVVAEVLSLLQGSGGESLGERGGVGAGARR